MNKYGPKAQKVIGKVLHDYSQGKLKSGNSNNIVKDRKQAIVIGTEKARDMHYKVPNNDK